MANSQYCVVEADGDEAELSRFYNVLLLVGGDLRRLLSSMTDARVESDFLLSPAGQRPISVAFDCNGLLPDELVRSVSKLFPTLVLSLFFIDEMSCHVGFAIYRDGEHLRAAINNDVFWFNKHDHDALTAEALHPEAATIDGHEAVNWASLLHEALNVVPSAMAAELGLGNELIDLERFVDLVEELGPEYEHATTPLGSSRRFLDGLCERASLLEARVACRLAVRAALGNPVKVGGSGQVPQSGRIDPPNQQQ